MRYVLDLDGTLIDSSERHYLLMQQVLDKKSFNGAEFMKYKSDGNSGKKYLTECLNLPETDALEIMKLWQAQIEEEQWLSYDKLYPDTLEFLDWIKSRDSKIYFLTARQREEAVLNEVKRLGIADYANEICVVSPTEALEQKKAFVKKMIKEDSKTDVIIRDDLSQDNGIHNDLIHIVGDTENEYRLAKDLSLPYSILNRGFRSKKYWDNQGVSSVSSLREIIDRDENIE